MFPIQNIAELFIYDEREFITAAYRALLGRDPDPTGMNYYLGRLRMGYGKAAIITQISNSSGESLHGNIKGLANLIKDEKRANHWFWGIFTSRQRNERLMHQHINELKRLNINITQQPRNTVQASIPDAAPNESNLILPTLQPTESAELDELTPHAKDIFLKLSTVAARNNRRTS